jgi:hypothetical protein
MTGVVSFIFLSCNQYNGLCSQVMLFIFFSFIQPNDLYPQVTFILFSFLRAVCITRTVSIYLSSVEPL